MIRRLGLRILAPFIGYFDHRFAEVNAELERVQAEVAVMRSELRAEVDAMHEFALRADRERNTVPTSSVDD